SSYLGGRGRLRPKPEVADNDQLQPPRATTEEPLPRPSRPRQRGTSRYTPPTFRPKTEPPSNPAIRDRAKTTEPPGAIDSTPEPPRRRFRRPVSRAASEHTKSNELEDSPIVRITQGPPRNTFVSRSRSAVKDEEDNDKITNIRVFKKPSAVNRDIYARTRYTKKRNNLETEEPRKDTSSYSSTTASTVTLLEARDLAAADRPSSEPATEQTHANSVDEEHSASTRSSVATDAQITATDLEDGVTTTESYLENEVVTVTPDGGVDQGLGTTNSVKVEDFDPNVIRIVFPSNGTDSNVQENRNVAVPRRRKVLLRKRPVASSSTASQEEEEEDKLVSRRRKVIRRLRPVQNSTTETTVDISSTEEDQIVLRFGSTSPKQEDTTNLDLSTESFDASTVETSRTIEYGIGNDFTGATLETPTAETAIDNEELSDPDAITMASTIIDSFTGESFTETSTAESATSTSLFNSTDTNNVFDETSTPSDQTATLTTTMSTASTVATQSNRRLESYDRTYYLDSRYVRKKFVRRRPIDSSENVSSRYPASRSLIRVSSTTENSNLEGLSKRRKGLFVRRRPVSSTTTTTTAQVVESKGGKLSDERDLEPEEQIDSEDATLRMNRAHDETQFTIDLPAKSDSDEFWSHYTTATPTSHEDLAPLTPRTKIFIEEHSTPASNRRPEFRPRYRVPESLKKTVSTENSYPLDSSPEETEETNDSKLKYHNFRQPRTRYKYREGVGEEKYEGNEESVPDATESPSFDFSSQLRTRFYARRPVSSTEPPVTETLVPARKFDYVADAHRRQQSLRTTPRVQNEDSTTLRSPSEEIQNLVDADYTTTIPPKPQVTRLVTSVEESGTTERQKILIKTKYSSLTSTTRIPLQTTPTTVQSVVSDTSEKSKGSSGGGNEDESANEIRQGNVERSTLPIEGEFLQQPIGRFTTESHESSTIEIESVFSNLIGSRDQLS
ncbi:uncharacterized protein LOC143370036, partial [Andrena cerasifolii]|uniref:uncharacterized protein LOC143370036 n=1 Tax=Andrena cerasifolii TaxID=2819439 RepID=UPI004037B407